jgi:ketosteroid isomerase-like protein
VFTGSADDQLKIRQLFDSYCDATCRQAVDDYLACWTDDGVRLGDGGECHGIVELRAHWDGIWKAVAKMAFMVQIGAIEVDGDHARARSYCLEVLEFRGGGTHRLIGNYEDLLRRVDGEWRFSERNYRVFLNEGSTNAQGSP